MFKYTFKTVDKLTNNTDIQNIRMSVNRSLGLDMPSMYDESSDISEMTSESSSDSDMLSVSETCCSPDSRHEADLENLVQLPCDEISLRVDGINTIQKNAIKSDNESLEFGSLEHNRERLEYSESNDNPKYLENLHSHLPKYNKRAQQPDINISDVMENNSDVVTEITENSSVEEHSKDSSLCVSDKNEKSCLSNIFPAEIERNLDNMKFPVLSKERNSNAKHVCPHCSKCFRFPSKLKRHIRSHKLSENISENEETNEISGTVSMNEHCNSMGSEPTADSPEIEKRKAKCVQKCPFCSRIFKVPSKLARHIKTHEALKPYACQFCPKTFLEKFNLLAHVNIHKQEKTYVCDICQRRFNFKSNLTRHLKSHMKKKSFICSECDDTYDSEKKLAFHVRKHEEKSYKCIECAKVFKKKYNLKRHSDIHLNERSYPCDLCDYVAKRNSHRKRHIERNHGNDSEKKLAVQVRNQEEKPYNCIECAKVFKKKSHFKRHSEIHSNERRYPCDLCDYVAKRKSHTKRHIERNHAK